MQKTIRLLDMPAFRKNDGNGDIIRFDDGGGVNRLLN